MINVVKLYPLEEQGDDGDASSASSPSSSSSPFLAFGRIMSGTVCPGQKVRVLGEHYSEHDDLEDMALATVSSVAIGQGRYQLEVDRAPAGCWVMMRGVDHSITHTTAICLYETLSTRIAKLKSICLTMVVTLRFRQHSDHFNK